MDSRLNKIYQLLHDLEGRYGSLIYVPDGNHELQLLRHLANPGLHVPEHRGIAKKPKKKA